VYASSVLRTLNIAEKYAPTPCVAPYDEIFMESTAVIISRFFFLSQVVALKNQLDFIVSISDSRG